MPPLPVRIIRGACPPEEGTCGDQREYRYDDHAPGLALNVRNGIEGNLSADECGVIATHFGGQRVCCFVASGGKKKCQVPDKTQGEHFG